MVSVMAEQGKAHFDEDAVLVERFLGGDADAFHLLYDRYYDKVYAIARGILLDADEAADAVQEIFTLVYRHLPRFDRRARFSTWLFRISVNRSIQQGRRLKHKNRWVPLDEGLAAADAPEEPHTDPKIHLALASIQPADRALLVLFYWDELSLQEIGESIGCGVNAAKTRLYRARERFRAAYEELES
ncbi:MAG: sigma-70 family RNA polymerase sigma factor [Fimbriimonadaceae bacterium]|nr:sigma-70 family RNA polymerase sigma factor [Chthonomonadaceae bacterium]MCO5295316.1 sigma-70 family RNA polymerase sigma factor [Fimbriimonadaceae bacterium]